MITLSEYVGTHLDSPDWTEKCRDNATNLLAVCGLLEQEMTAEGVIFLVNPLTGSGVSGETYGGFRPQNCTIGASNSAHKTGEAVDRYDPGCKIDDWLMANQDALVKHGIYIEHPDSTPGWSHWSTRSPGSGHHVFFP